MLFREQKLLPSSLLLDPRAPLCVTDEETLLFWGWEERGNTCLFQQWLLLGQEVFSKGRCRLAVGALFTAMEIGSIRC